MQNEWDINVGVSKPKNLIALCKTDVNMYDVRGYELRWQKRGPWIDGLIVKYCKFDWNKLDVSALKSLWIVEPAKCWSVLELRNVTVNMDSEMEISLKDIGVDFLLVTVNSLTRNKAKNAN